MLYNKKGKLDNFYGPPNKWFTFEFKYISLDINIPRRANKIRNFSVMNHRCGQQYQRYLKVRH